MRIFILNFFLIFLTSFSLLSQEKNAVQEVSYFIDSNKDFSFEKAKLQNFTPLNSNILNLGFVKGDIWVKIKVDTLNLNSTAILETKSPQLEYVSLYFTTHDDDIVSKQLGTMIPQKENELYNLAPTFKIPIKNLKSNELYLRISSKWAITAEFKASNETLFRKSQVNYYFILALLFGGLLFMIIYNFFLYISLKDFGYLLYSLALITSLISQGFYEGIFVQFLDSIFPNFSSKGLFYFMALGASCTSWFAYSFLQINRSFKAVHFLLLFAIFSPFVTVFLELFSLYDLSRKIITLQVFLISMIISISSVYSYIKGNKIALYFIVAWAVYLTGAIANSLKTFGVLAPNLFTNYSLILGAFLETMLLSFALAHKYLMIRQEKVRLERRSKEELERLVKTQTIELENSLEEKEVLLKEIHHRVKNNLQIIISLLDLQVASLKDSENKSILMQSKARVYSMSLIHQKLYQSDNLGLINIDNYLNDLLSYIRNGYEDRTSNIKYNVDIEEDINLPISKSIPLGLIVNELLTNSLKYGMDLKHPESIIKLSAQLIDNKLELIVADNGPGFDNFNEINVKKSLGLFLVKSLTKQLKGEIIRYHEQNLFVTKLSFPISR